MAPSFVQAAVSSLCVGFALANSHYTAVLDKRAAVIPSILLGTWAYQGCYTDTGARVLSGSSYVNTTGMTDESCIKYCDGLGYYYAGSEYSQECCELLPPVMINAENI
jgi:WSC domain